MEVVSSVAVDADSGEPGGAVDVGGVLGDGVVGDSGVGCFSSADWYNNTNSVDQFVASHAFAAVTVLPLSTMIARDVGIIGIIGGGTIIEGWNGDACVI